MMRPEEKKRPEPLMDIIDHLDNTVGVVNLMNRIHTNNSILDFCLCLFVPVVVLGSKAWFRLLERYLKQRQNDRYTYRTIKLKVKLGELHIRY